MGIGRLALTGTAAGAAGTAVMNLTLGLERLLRGRPRQPMDYDSSAAPVLAVDHLLHLPDGWGTDSPLVGRVVHWGYGSTAGTAHAALRARGVREPWASAAFFAASWGTALAAFPLLRATPPPWRWPRDMLVSGFVQHAVYAAATGLAAAALRRGAV